MSLMLDANLQFASKEVAFEPFRTWSRGHLGMDKSCLLMVQLMSNMPASPYKSPYFKSEYLNN